MIFAFFNVENYSFAQPKEFSTYFVVEDAESRNDTIWYKADKDGSFDKIDISLGESEILQPIDSSLFFVIGPPTYSNNEFLISNDVVSNATTYNQIGFNIIFINAKFPVKISLNRNFIDSSNEFDYRFTNYFMTYCQNPFLMEFPMMWYDAEGFECLLNNPVLIYDPQVKKSEYSCNDHYLYEIDVMDKGLQTFYGIEIATIILDDYCYSKLETNKNTDVNQTIIYPNPANDYLKVKLITGKDLNYTINGITGGTICKGKSEHEGTIDINKLQPGIYIITLSDDCKNTYRQKFVKN